MSSQENQEERKFILEVIKLYRTLPALWNVKSKDYTDRNKREYLYEILLRKYRERYRSADKIQLLKKLHNMRTCFRREMRRINAAQKSGNGEVHSTLWYYGEMEFLINQENEINLENKGKEKNENDQEYLRNKIQTDKKKSILTKQEQITPKRLNRDTKDFISLKTVAKRTSLSPNEVVTSTPRQIVSVQNEFEQIAACWIMELQKMDARQQLFAKKAINDILFEGQLGNLHRNSVEINRTSHEYIPKTSKEQKSNSLTSQESIIYEDEEEPHISEIENVKFEIEHIDPIEVDNSINCSTPEYNEETITENTETTIDLGVDTQQTLENHNFSSTDEEAEGKTNLKNNQTWENQICSSNDPGVDIQLFENSICTYTEEREPNDKNESEQIFENNSCFSELEEDAYDKSKTRKKRKHRRVMCSYCSKIICHTALRKHEETHKEQRERKEICPYCGIKMFTKSSMYSHLKTHEENREKKLHCEFCDRSYYNRGALNIHKRIHLGQMSQCPICSKQYVRKIDLDRHMTSHSAFPLHNVMKKYKNFVHCKDCGKKIPTKRWKSHKAVHMKKPLVKCTICNKDFFNRSSCSRHVRLLHHITKEDYNKVILQYEEKPVRQSLLLLKQQEIVELKELE